MPLGGALIGGAASLLSGIIGGISSANDRAAAQQAAQEAMQQINAIGAPPDLAKRIILEKFKSAGILTPELEHNISLGVSQASQTKTDPKLQADQQEALQLIKQRAQGGLSPVERANLDEIRQNAAQNTRAKTDQLLQSFAQRGQGGGGASLAAQLAAAQSGNQEQARAGLQQGAIASQNALSAIGQQGSMAGQMRGQDFSENQARAQAADAFKQFDTANQIAQQARNVNAGNQAQATNLQNDQNISNANTSAGNAELQRQVAAQQQMWQDQMAVQQAKAAALTGKAQQSQQQAQNTAQSWQNIGAGVSGAANAVGGAMGKQQDAANDMTKFKMLHGLLSDHLNNNSSPEPLPATVYSP